MSKLYVCVGEAPLEPAWAVLVPATVEEVAAALDRVFMTPLEDEDDEYHEPLEVWRGTGDYTAITGPFPKPEDGSVDPTIPTELACSLSRELSRTAYAVVDEEDFVDLCFAYSDGRAIEAGRTDGPHVFAATLGCVFRRPPTFAYEPPGGASMIVVEGRLPSRFELPPDVLSSEVVRQSRTLTLVWYTELHSAFTPNEITTISHQLGDRVMYWFTSVPEASGTEWLQYEELMRGVSSRFGGGDDAEAAMRSLGIDWSDLRPKNE